MNKTRLLKLATHLESGKLGHAKFDFNQFNIGGAGPDKCGTRGCAIGECPIAFPRQWKFGLDGMPVLRDSVVGWTHSSGEKFFRISTAQFEFLFLPYGGSAYPNELDVGATASAVAKHIRKFVARGGIY